MKQLRNNNIKQLRNNVCPTLTLMHCKGQTILYLIFDPFSSSFKYILFKLRRKYTFCCNFTREHKFTKHVLCEVKQELNN